MAAVAFVCGSAAKKVVFLRLSPSAGEEVVGTEMGVEHLLHEAEVRRSRVGAVSSFLTHNQISARTVADGR